MGVPRARRSACIRKLLLPVYDTAWVQGLRAQHHLGALRSAQPYLPSAPVVTSVLPGCCMDMALAHGAVPAKDARQIAPSPTAQQQGPNFWRNPLAQCWLRLCFVSATQLLPLVC